MKVFNISKYVIKQIEIEPEPYKRYKRDLNKIIKYYIKLFKVDGSIKYLHIDVSNEFNFPFVLFDKYRLK
jgi:hypothetical protein